MEEADRIGVNIVVSTVAGAVGTAIGGPVGGIVSGTLPYIVQEVTARRRRNVERVAENASDEAGFDGQSLLAWVQSSDANAQLFMSTLEAAWTTLDDALLVALGHALADGLADPALIDMQTQVVRALREMDSSQVRMLAKLATPSDRDNELWLVDDLKSAFPQLSDAVDPITARLDQLGCTESQVVTYPGTSPIARAASAFGRRCLEAVTKGTAAE